MLDKKAISKAFSDAQASLVTQTSDLPLGTLADMVISGAIDLAPSFQRRERWSKEQQAALIESFLMNVPVPPLYLAEEEYGTYLAIDGKQRLNAIAEFMSNRLALRNLESLDAAQGATFSELPMDVQNALRIRPYLRVVTLLKQTNERMKFEVFLRLNRGGEALNAQEIRNVAFRGKLNTAINETAESSAFLRKVLKISSTASEAYRQMQDAEYILRFLALHRKGEDFKGSLATEMDSFMEDNDDVDAATASKIVGKFTEAIGRCESIWGDFAFKRPDRGTWRDQTLAGMYDAQMLAVCALSNRQFERLKERSDEVRNATRALFDDDSFEKAVRSGTNTPARISYRVARTTEMLNGLVD